MKDLHAANRFRVETLVKRSQRLARVGVYLAFGLGLVQLARAQDPVSPCNRLISKWTWGPA